MISRCSVRRVVAVVAVGLTGCRGCAREEGPAQLLDIATPETPAAAHLGALGTVVTHVEAFANRATARAGATLLQRARDGVKQQLGIDPLSRAELESFGVDTGEGALMFTEPGTSEAVLAFGVSDRDKLDAALAKLIERADGANRLTEEQASGRMITSVGRPFGDQTVPVVHWAHVGRFALLTRAEGLDALKKVLERLRTPALEGSGLASSPAWRELSAKVPAGDLLVYVRASGQVNADAVTSVRLGPEGFSTDSYADLRATGLGAALQGPAPLDLAGRIDANAVLFGLTRAAKPDGVAAMRAQPQVGELIAEAQPRILQATGIDLEKEALPLLAGPATAAVVLQDVARLPERIQGMQRAGGATPRSLGQLLDVIHIVLTADVKDEPAMLALLERSQKRLLEQKIAIKKRSKPFGGKNAIIFEPDRPDPKLGWALWSGQYVYAVGSGRLEQTLSQLARGPTELPARLPNTTGGELAKEVGASVVIVRLDAIAEALGAAKLGGGQVGIGQLVASAIDLLRTLDEVAVSVQPEGDGLRLKTRQRFE